jgi:hypothetical protein
VDREGRRLSAAVLSQGQSLEEGSRVAREGLKEVIVEADGTEGVKQEVPLGQGKQPVYRL